MIYPPAILLLAGAAALFGYRGSAPRRAVLVAVGGEQTVTIGAATVHVSPTEAKTFSRWRVGSSYVASGGTCHCADFWGICVVEVSAIGCAATASPVW